MLTDQMRPTAMGCAGVEEVHTPHLDRLAAQGTRFTNAVSNTPACTPARATLLTGLHTITHQAVNNDIQLRTDVRSIAHCLNEAGYHCAYIGKWHLDRADRGAFIPPGPRRQGFDDFWAVAQCNHRYFQGYYYMNVDPDPVWIDDYEPNGQTDLANQYIRERTQDDGPFCLFLSWGPPHCPYRVAPQKYLDMYPPQEIELLPNARETPRFDRTMRDQGASSTQIEAAKKELIAGYYAHISALDACLGSLMETLERAGAAEDTLVIFSSDHGDMLFSQDRGWKGKPWRESVGIPLIVRWPDRIPAGRVTNGPIGLVDLMPTILSFAGAEIPPEVEGQDLTTFLCGDETAAPRSEFINFLTPPARFSYRAWRGVVTRTHTYARFRDEPWILHDDSADPFQMHNLAHSPAHRALREEFDALIREWLARTHDPFETSRQVADRYYVGHVDMIMPHYVNERIVAGQQARADRQY
jgi:arylsulfatase A-like enzyme